jgi:hypothetical protein
MARSSSAFRQGDVTRALRAARAAGVNITRVEIEPATGKIVIVTGGAPTDTEQVSDLDRWMASNARAS